MITAERKQELQALGYYVEDMGAAHGAEFAGQYRWMKRNADDFQDGGTSDSEYDAWIECSHSRYALTY